MPTTIEREALRDAAEGVPANAEVSALVADAFDRFGTAALWYLRRNPTATFGAALVVAESLRREGNLRARALAEQIETACRAAL